MKPVFVALTDAGLATARRAADAIGGEVLPITDVAAQIRALFAEGRPIVGICAAGILIRILAPLLADKRDEPPVVALSEDGASVVPLLGGHRGANDLARRLAEALGGHAAITTAGDNRFGIALDAPPEGWTLANPEDAKNVMAALLAGASARLEGDAPWLAESGIPFAPDGRGPPRRDDTRDERRCDDARLSSAPARRRHRLRAERRPGRGACSSSAARLPKPGSRENPSRSSRRSI